MSGEVIELTSFRFNSLHKYMQPLYSSLNATTEGSKEEKRELIKKIVPQFFSRLRTYRNIPIEVVASKSKRSCEELEMWELGMSPVSRELEDIYIQICSGHDELDFFRQTLAEFMNPIAKQNREEIAISLLKKMGLRIPTVDYKNLNGQKGKVLDLQRLR